MKLLKNVALLSFVFVLLFSIFFLPASLLALWMDHEATPYAVAVAALVTFIILGQRAVFRSRSSEQHPSDILSWTLHAVFGLMITIGLYALLLWATTLIPGLKETSEVAHARGYSVWILSVLTGIFGFLQARQGPKIVRVEVPLEQLPAAFEGFKIAQISDLHAGHTIGREYVENVVRQTQALSPHLITLTGDFADGTVETLRDVIAPLKELSAPSGKFFITGNHEYYWGAGAWINEHRRLGSQVLLNEHVIIRRSSDEITLGGVTDYTAGRMQPDHASDIAKAFSGAPQGGLRILLAHQPVSYRSALKAGVHLQLSGHTHGGQWFPASLVVRMAQRYLAGLYKVENLWLYVSRGSGYWGPPLRFLVRSEITLLTLVSEKRTG